MKQKNPKDNGSSAALSSPQKFLQALWIKHIQTCSASVFVAAGGFLKQIELLQPTTLSPFCNTGTGRSNFVSLSSVLVLPWLIQMFSDNGKKDKFAL